MRAAGTYSAREFARLSGVTVRTLHHYDRIGLLIPKRNAAGYRLYRDSDLERLEQIVALKFIGVPLQVIGDLLDGSVRDFSLILRAQQIALEEKQRRLQIAIAAIREAECAIRTGTGARSSILRRVIEVIHMENENSDWMLKYFSDEAKPKLESRRAAWTPELQARVEQDWSDLFRDIRLALDEDPASAKAQALVDRWNDLIRQFTGGEPELAGGVKALYADRAHWPAAFEQQMKPFTDERVWDFFRRAVAARRAVRQG